MSRFSTSSETQFEVYEGINQRIFVMPPGSRVNGDVSSVCEVSGPDLAARIANATLIAAGLDAIKAAEKMASGRNS